MRLSGLKWRTYNLQDQRNRDVEANVELGLTVDCHEYNIGAHVLESLWCTQILG